MAFRDRFRSGRTDPAPDAVADDDLEDDEALENDEALEDDEAGEWLAYELHEWASESRSMLAQLLSADGVSHSWQGTTLLAHETVEEQVDQLIEEVVSGPRVSPTSSTPTATSSVTRPTRSRSSS